MLTITDLPAAIVEKIEVVDTHWMWTGWTNDTGYPYVRHDLSDQPAYRVTYELLVGPIPQGLELDHLCVIPCCLNPGHLEPVTHAENMRRVSARQTSCRRAVEVHNQNHPDADHAAVDLHEEDPRYFPRTDILWASPECTKWSQASGGKYSKVSTDVDLFDFLDPELVDEDPEVAIVQRSRLLMFDVLRFAEHHRYKAMVIENVVDVARNPKFAEAWSHWKKCLRDLGYEFRVVSLNSMHAQAHGDPAPQSRDRLYVVCWLKGNRAPDIDKVMRPLAWCPKCSEVVESQQVWKNGRTVGKYRTQYIYLHGACGTAVEPTQETKALVVPLEGRAGDRINSSGDPLRTQTSRHLDALAMPPFLTQFRERVRDLDPTEKPFPTIVADGASHALVSPFIAELRGGGSTARPVDDPMSTVTASGNHHGLVVPAGGTWNDDARPTDEAHRTMTTRETSALVMPYYGTSKSAAPADNPLGTVTTVDRHALIQRHNSSTGDGAEMLTPAAEYLRTLTTKGHQSLLTPGDIAAAEAHVDDCLFRMLEPHEIAAGMAFPADYIWGGTRRERVKLCGNAVTPPAARDLIAAVVESLA